MSPRNSGAEREEAGDGRHLESWRDERPGITMPPNAINLHWVYGQKKAEESICQLNKQQLFLSVNYRKGNIHPLNKSKILI